MKSGSHWTWMSCAALLALAGLAGAGELPGGLGGQDMGTVYVKPTIYLIGPIAECGKVRLPEAGNSQAVYGCPASVLLVPGHYDPIPMPNWRLTGSTRFPCEYRNYQCIVHVFLGFIPIPVSYECIANSEVQRGPSYVVSWEAEPYTRREPVDPVSTVNN